MMDFVFKMMDSVLQMMDLLFKMMDVCIQNDDLNTNDQGGGSKSVGLVVCDMNFDACAAAKVVASTARLLRPGAMVAICIIIDEFCTKTDEFGS